MSFVLPRIKACLSAILWAIASDRLKHWKTQIDAIKLRYRTAMKREADLFNPVRFSEKMQWRKLFEDSPLFTQLSDKIAARDYIAAHGFSSILIPQLWAGKNPRAIPFDVLPRPYVIKSSHGCGQTIIVTQDEAIDRYQIIAQAKSWLAHCHGTDQLEPGYLDIPPQIIVETLLVCSDGRPPAELKVFVFDGTARFAQYIGMRRNRAQPFAFVDRNWQRSAWQGLYPPLTLPGKPVQFDLALTVAEKLCAEMDHCRVDFYLVDEKLFIGEITLYTYSGLVLLRPEGTDAEMGSYWNIKWPKARALIAIMTRRWGRQHGPDRTVPEQAVLPAIMPTRTAPDLHLVADDGIVAPHVSSQDELRFLVPDGVLEVRLVSPNFRAAGGDVRRLGVIVRSIAVSDGAGWHEIPLDAPGLFAGFHDVERSEGGCWRWTDGEAHLSPQLWDGLSGPVLLRLTGVFTGLVPSAPQPDNDPSAT